MPADLLARELRDTLVAQGISVRSGPGTTGALTFVPVNSANALIVFGASAEMPTFVAECARRLDPPTDDGAGSGMFIFPARPTTVHPLVPVVLALSWLQGNITDAQTPTHRARTS